MKALEKAAKDRGESRAEPVAAAPAASTAKLELALEPIAPEAPAGASRPEAAPRAAAARSSSASAAAAPTREQLQAVTVLQAGARPASGFGAFVRAHPVTAIAAAAALTAVGFGLYVYLQIFHPALFLPQPPLAKAPLAQTPSAVLPLPAEPVLQARAAEPEPPAVAAAPAEPRAKQPPSAPSTPAAAPRNTIAVSPGGHEPALNPLLAEAYAALQANRLDAARALYERLAAAEPRNIDALLGLAALALLQGATEEATARYLQILELDPQHAAAQSGLIGLLGRADPLAAETKLKQLIAREPSAHLYFTLGNLYADQSQWAAAQQAYFQAYHLEPTNPDYAYNLAVGLDHMSQPKLALGFYRRALELAATRGHASFDLPQVQVRIARLAQQVE